MCNQYYSCGMLNCSKCNPKEPTNIRIYTDDDRPAWDDYDTEPEYPESRTWQVGQFLNVAGSLEYGYSYQPRSDFMVSFISREDARIYFEQHKDEHQDFVLGVDDE